MTIRLASLQLRARSLRAIVPTTAAAALLAAGALPMPASADELQPTAYRATTLLENASGRRATQGVLAVGAHASGPNDPGAVCYELARAVLAEAGAGEARAPLPVAFGASTVLVPLHLSISSGPGGAVRIIGVGVTALVAEDGSGPSITIAASGDVRVQDGVLTSARFEQETGVGAATATHTTCALERITPTAQAAAV